MDWKAARKMIIGMALMATMVEIRSTADTRKLMREVSKFRELSMLTKAVATLPSPPEEEAPCCIILVI